MTVPCYCFFCEISHYIMTISLPNFGLVYHGLEEQRWTNPERRGKKLGLYISRTFGEPLDLL